MKILILGAGEVGAHLARVLSPHAEIVLIDRNQTALGSVEDGLDVLTVAGDITHRRVLQDAGAAQASLVIAVTGSDDANLVGAALAAEIGAKKSVARVDDASFYQTKNAVETGALGIHVVLCAARLVGDELLRMISQQSADSVQSFGRNMLHVASLAVKEFHPVCGKPVSALNLKDGCALALVGRDGRPMLPADASRIELGDHLVLCGPPVPLTLLNRSLTGSAAGRAMVIGGGDVGMQVAQSLSAFEGQVQLVEKSPERAEYLAEHLTRVNVICGDGSSIATLRDEHIQSVDYSLSLTRSDEVNLMVSLIARELGVSSTYTLVHRPGYEEVYRHLGVHGTTGPHDVLARAVARMLPYAKKGQGQALAGTHLECMEFSVPRSLKKELPLGRLSLPPGVFLLGRVEESEGLLAAKDPVVSGQLLIVAAPPHLFLETERYLSRLGERG